MIQVSGWNVNAAVPVFVRAPTCVVPSPSAEIVAASALPSLFQSPATMPVLLQVRSPGPNVATPLTSRSAKRDAADNRWTRVLPSPYEYIVRMSVRPSPSTSAAAHFALVMSKKPVGDDQMPVHPPIG